MLERGRGRVMCGVERGGRGDPRASAVNDDGCDGRGGPGLGERKDETGDPATLRFACASRNAPTDIR